MGKYDLDSVLNDSYKLNYSELIDDMQLDLGDDRTSAYHLLNNAQKTGIIDRIYKYIHLDLGLDETRSREETFEAFKLVKYIYETQYNDGIPVLEILCKPRMSHTVMHENDKNNIFGKDLDKITGTISSIIPESTAKCNRNIMEHIFQQWHQLNILLCRIVRAREFMINDKETGDKCIEFINDNLESIVEKTDSESPYRVGYKGSVMVAFYNILCSYHYKCAIVDLKNQNTALELNTYKKDESSEKFIFENETSCIEYEKIEGLNKYISKKKTIPDKEEYFYASILPRLKEIFSENPKVNSTRDLMSSDEYFYIILIDYIYKGLPFDEKNPKDIRFALKHMKTVLKWWIPDGETDSGILYNESQISVHIFITVMQELIYLSHTGQTYLNDYIGFKHANTYTSRIKNPDKIDAVGLHALINRLEFRYSVVTGQNYAHEIMIHSESLIYQIMEYILSFKNVEDMLFVSDFLDTWVRRYIITGVTEAQVNEEQVLEIINEKTEQCNIKEITFDQTTRILLYENADFIELMTDRIAEKINITYAVEDELSDTYNIILIDNERESISEKFSYTETIKFTVIVDVSENTVHCQEMQTCQGEEYIKRMVELGLDEFIKTE